MLTEPVYKLLNEDGTTPHNYGTWPLATQNDEGVWTSGASMPALKGKLVPCLHGYHLLRRQDLLAWRGPTLWLVEVEDPSEYIVDRSKIVVRQARLIERVKSWNERNLRLLAADYAEHVLHLFESQRPGDPRVRDCIEAVRKYANGEISYAVLQEARRLAADAAYAAYAAAADADADAAVAAAVYAVAADAVAAVGAAADAAVYAANANAAYARKQEQAWQHQRMIEVIFEGRYD